MGNDLELALTIVGFAVVPVILAVLYDRFRKAPRTTTDRCTFCGSTRSAVDVLISGPAVFVCGACVNLLSELVQEAKATQS